MASQNLSNSGLTKAYAVLMFNAMTLYDLFSTLNMSMYKDQEKGSSGLSASSTDNDSVQLAGTESQASGGAGQCDSEIYECSYARRLILVLVLSLKLEWTQTST